MNTMNKTLLASLLSVFLLLPVCGHPQTLKPYIGATVEHSRLWIRCVKVHYIGQWSDSSVCMICGYDPKMVCGKTCPKNKVWGVHTRGLSMRHTSNTLCNTFATHPNNPLTEPLNTTFKPFLVSTIGNTQHYCNSHPMPNSPKRQKYLWITYFSFTHLFP